MEELIKKHRNFWSDKTIQKHVIFSFILLIVSFLLFYFAKVQTNEYSGYVVPDILLDTIPVINVGYIFFQGAFIFVLFVIVLLALDPVFIPFTFENVALFIFARSVFMNMTHLSAPSVEYYKYIEHEHHVQSVLFTLSSGNDLFFSGHAGTPFLLALIFWHKKQYRYLFLFCSVVASVAVIVGHLHYTIDVFSSFFITFGVFEAAKKFFKKEYALVSLLHS